MGGKVAAATEHRNAQRVVARLAAMPPADCAVSVVTVYELFTGSRQMPGARARAGEGGALAGRDERALI